MKKYRALFSNGGYVDFGATGYSDYTIHHDPERKRRYMIRHQKKENWTKSGIKSAGFWSRWLLWEKPSLKGAMNTMKSKFGIQFVMT
jgi:hypothetical protein